MDWEPSDWITALVVFTDKGLPVWGQGPGVQDSLPLLPPTPAALGFLRWGHVLCRQTNMN